MPVNKQIIYNSSAYGDSAHPEILEDSLQLSSSIPLISYNDKDIQTCLNSDQIVTSIQASIIKDSSMTSMLGLVHQLSYFSSTTLELFQNISYLTNDVQDRINKVSARTTKLTNKISTIEKNLSYSPESYRMKINGIRDSLAVNELMSSREMVTPSLFIKSTNYSSIRSLYKNCLSLPQFWKIECYLGQDDDCFKYYSYPGFFFESWLKTELERQEALLEQNKKDKIEKKNNKIEKRRLKNELRSLHMNQYYNDEIDNNIDNQKKYANSILIDNKGGDYSNEDKPTNLPTVSLTKVFEDSLHINNDNYSDTSSNNNYKNDKTSNQSSGLLKLRRVSTTSHQSETELSNDQVTNPKIKINLTNNNNKLNTPNKRMSIVDFLGLSSKNKKNNELELINEDKNIKTPTNYTNSVKLSPHSNNFNDLDFKRNNNNYSGGIKEAKEYFDNGDNYHNNNSSSIPIDMLSRRLLTGGVNNRVSNSETKSQQQYSILSDHSKNSLNYNYNNNKYESNTTSNVPRKSLLSNTRQSFISDTSYNNKNNNFDNLESKEKRYSKPEVVDYYTTSDVSPEDDYNYILENLRTQKKLAPSVSMKTGSKYLSNSLHKGKEKEQLLDTIEEVTVNSSEATSTTMKKKTKKNKDKNKEDDSTTISHSTGTSATTQNKMKKSKTLLQKKKKDPFSIQSNEGSDNLDSTNDNIENNSNDRSIINSNSSFRPPPPPPPPSAFRPPPPPPPPVPKSLLSADLLGGIKAGLSLKKAPEPPVRTIDVRSNLLNAIKSNGKGLLKKSVEAPMRPPPVQQNKAVAAILANRFKIAGSDSESDDDSDSDFTDE